MWTGGACRRWQSPDDPYDAYVLGVRRGGDARGMQAWLRLLVDVAPQSTAAPGAGGGVVEAPDPLSMAVETRTGPWSGRGYRQMSE